MKMNFFLRRIALMSAIILAGCATDVPSYNEAPAQEILQTVAANFESIKTLSGPCHLKLVSESGESVALTAAIAARLPDQLRLRAWKLDHVVFDVTVHGADVWVVPMTSGAGSDSLPQIPIHEIARVMRFLSGTYFKEAQVLNQSPATITVSGSSDFASVMCQIDTRTLTPRAFTFEQVTSQEFIPRVLMDHYRSVALPGNATRIMWPDRLVFERGDASITLYLEEVEINGELSESALKPPSRALKQP